MPERKIWQVTYGRVARDQPLMVAPSTDLDVLKKSLARNLSEIAAFAGRQKLDGFARAFEKGLECLESATPSLGLFHADMSSAAILPLPAQQLLAATQAAWVFGGMGSWNDVGFEGQSQADYERLSEELYGLLNASIVAATNASMPHMPLQGEPARKRAWWQFWERG
jgi:hypothetical protein